MPCHHPAPPRRRLLRLASTWPLAGLAALAGCASPWPEVPAGPGSPSARNRLQEAAAAHGLTAWRGLADINARFSRAWPALVGPAAAGPLELRLLPGSARSMLAAAQPPALRAAGTALPAHDPSQRVQAGQPAQPAQSAQPAQPAQLAQLAPLAQAHRLLLLGPLAVIDQAGVVNWGPPETLDGQRCDQLHLALAPGLDGSAPARLSLYIDRERGLLRRLRLSLRNDAPDASVAEVDFFDHLLLHGVLWPRRFQAPPGVLLASAAPQPWWLTGLDVNRGYAADALAGAAFSGAAAAAARPLPGT